MIIGGIIAICIVLAVLAFVVPRLTSGPQRGVDRTLGVGQSAGAKAPGPLGRLFQKGDMPAVKQVKASRNHHPR